MELVRRGRDEFLREAAGGAVVRPARALNSPSTRRGHEPADSTLVVGLDSVLNQVAAEATGIEVLPLAKKAGAAFSDMITVGRTTNNDVVLNDVTVSRFHAYFKHGANGWIVCDAGSKNGTRLDGTKLDARKELPVTSGAALVFGEVPVTFYDAPELFEYLSNLAG